MPKVTVSHFNPPSTQGLTRCGLKLSRVKHWTTDPNDATCNNCRKLIKLDARESAPQG